MKPDIFNGIFELGGACFTFLSVLKLHKDKMVKGVHYAPIAFFTLWGYWNLYYYPHLEQWLSFIGGIVLVIVNTIWLFQMIYYRGNK